MPQVQWVFILDADERFTPELKAEVINAIKENSHVGFYVPRKNFLWANGSGTEDGGLIIP